MHRFNHTNPDASLIDFMGPGYRRNLSSQQSGDLSDCQARFRSYAWRVEKGIWSVPESVFKFVGRAM